MNPMMGPAVDLDPSMPRPPSLKQQLRMTAANILMNIHAAGQYPGPKDVSLPDFGKKFSQDAEAIAKFIEG